MTKKTFTILGIKFNFWFNEDDPPTVEPKTKEEINAENDSTIRKLREEIKQLEYLHNTSTLEKALVQVNKENSDLQDKNTKLSLILDSKEECNPTIVNQRKILDACCREFDKYQGYVGLMTHEGLITNIQTAIGKLLYYKENVSKLKGILHKL